MADTIKSTNDKLEQQPQLDKQVEDKNDAGQANLKKSKKKNKEKQETKIDDQTLLKLLDQRLQEIGEVPVSDDDPEIKAIKKKYKTLSKLTAEALYPDLTPEEKVKKLSEAYTALSQLNNFFEEHAYILSKLNFNAKFERDQQAKENANQVNYKVQLEKGCREVQKNNDHIKSVNKKFTEEETKRREELLQNFENTIKEVTDKMEAQKKQADEFAAENETLRATLTEKIKKFEEREKEFFEQIKQVDEKNDSKTKEVLAKLKEIENNAKKSFEVKDQIQKYKSSETETKFKIAIYSQRFGDFESTLGTTNDMLSRFKQELERTASRLKTLQAENKALKEKVDKIDTATLEIFNLTQDAKDELKKAQKEKDQVREKLVKIQGEVTAVNKKIQELESQKTAQAQQ